MNGKTLKDTDPKIFEALKEEERRQESGLQMIASENFASRAVMEATGSVLTNKYSEGYPNKRYYSGNDIVDIVESEAIKRAKELFKVPHANVQPYSGSPANAEVYLALCDPGDVIMGQHLSDGGHLTHGWKVSFSGRYFNPVLYNVREDGYIDLEQVIKLAEENKPKIIWVGASAYVREFPFKEIGELADRVGAYSVADVSHISGLILGGVHASPSEHVDLITTTTHKTLRGPRGAMIMVTEKGLQKDPELSKKIDGAVFPGFQGGPHNNVTAAIAVALKEASSPEFKDYAHQIVKNSKALAEEMMSRGMSLVSGGTDNHIILMDFTYIGKGHGVFAQEALETAGIYANKNTIPKDPSSMFYPSGLRLGTPSLTTMGMKEPEMRKIGSWIHEVIEETKNYKLPDDKTQIREILKNFRSEIKENPKLKEIKNQVVELCTQFPVYSTK